MSKSVAKVAVSIPAELYRALEVARKRARKTRSAIVQEALRDWLQRPVHGRLVRDYEAGYTNRPEDAGEVEAALATSFALFASPSA